MFELKSSTLKLFSELKVMSTYKHVSYTSVCNDT